MKSQMMGRCQQLSFDAFCGFCELLVSPLEQRRRNQTKGPISRLFLVVSSFLSWTICCVGSEVSTSTEELKVSPSFSLVVWSHLLKLGVCCLPSEESSGRYSLRPCPNDGEVEPGRWDRWVPEEQSQVVGVIASSHSVSSSLHKPSDSRFAKKQTRGLGWEREKKAAGGQEERKM